MNNIDRAIVLDEAKAYSDRKGGYVESGKVLADIDLKTGNGFEKFADMPEIGRTYTIVLDSGTYSAKCKEIEGIEGVGYCGNLSILGDAIEGAVDTGESFLIFVMHNDEGDGMTSYTVIDKNEGAHCTVSTAETIHPIDPKFLPDPVVLDLTKYDANGSKLNDLVLSLFMSGGGKTSVDNTDGTQAFWQDANTDGRIQLMIDATSVKIVSDVKSTTLEPDGKTLVAIETSFLIQQAGKTARVTVMFGALSHTTDITLVVEFLTISG